MNNLSILIIGGIIGLACSMIGGLLVYRTILKSHASLVARIELEEKYLREDLSSISKSELLRTVSGLQLLEITPSIEKSESKIEKIATEDENRVIQDRFDKIAASTNLDIELKKNLKMLAEAVIVMSESLSAKEAAEVAEDMRQLLDEATKSSPNVKWYSVSIEGLIKASKTLDKLGEPVINLSQKVLSLLKKQSTKTQETSARSKTG